MITRLVFLILCLIYVGCASTVEEVDGEQSSFAGAVNESEYQKLVDHFSRNDDKYSGFYSTFQYHATILNSNILESQLALKARDFKWPREAYFAEKEKTTESLGKESKVFISFFSPVHENDNLDSNKTIWKLWLVVEGVRYEGIATKTSGILAQHQRLYPYHSRFFTPYTLSFKVPMAKTQLSSSKLIITGPVGTSEVDFPPADHSKGL